ncbi:MAG: DUF4965 domain-containing protein [Ruminococcaceae bacterium]|nr:DUF4965 domain-containing protein [Oscillospiraceae bacterium]
MRLRPPATPLITVDPFFNVWCEKDALNEGDTVHWTGFANTIIATAEVDGVPYRLMGRERGIPAMKQVDADVNALTTTYVFEGAGVRLTLLFTSSLLLDDFYLLTRPVSYLEIKRESLDRKKHTVRVSIAVSEQICLDVAGDDEVVTEVLSHGKVKSVKMGSRGQKILDHEGDSARIDWGYFYLSTNEASGEVGVKTETVTSYDGIAREDKEMTMTFVTAAAEIGSSTLFTFSYDDIASIQYFGKNLVSYWNRNGERITDEIEKAFADYKRVLARCAAFSDRLFLDAVRAGGEKYAELLELAYRQTIAAHKLVLDENGEVLFISKECYSNGCAATVDVSYPSIPLFLIYNPELVKGMMRPIYRVAESDVWKRKYDFAPHDAGRYPLLNGQMYGYKDGDLLDEMQMPVEECGNMLVMEAAVAIAEGNVNFAKQHMDILDNWVKYLIENGRDPENQLCTDDFAGHLAHNCNLTLKAIMGLACYGILQGMLGKKREEKKYIAMARDMAKDWAVRAANGDGSYRLAFDREGTFSMKYNIVWDKLFGTEIMAREIIESELASYARHMHPYGMPLDNREPYTKSDWLVWTATLFSTREEFEAFIAPLWSFFHLSPSRVPMTDWYWTLSGEHKAYESRSYNPLHPERVLKSFRNRTVQGGLFIKLLEHKGIMKLK